MLRGTEPERVLQAAAERRIPAIMSYLSAGKWRLSRILMRDIEADRFSARVSPRKKSYLVNIQAGLTVGISFRYGYENGRYVFDTMVIGLEPATQRSGAETIVLAMPEQIELIQRRSYLRVKVPASLDVDVTMWHHGYIDGHGKVPPANCFEGKLVDISAGGIQIAVQASLEPDFRKGQYVGLRFSPLPYETPLVFNAYVKNIFPSVNRQCLCYGLQMVGLEASPEGRLILQRLCNVVEQYYQQSQSTGENEETVNL